MRSSSSRCDLPNAGPVLDALRAATGSVVVPVDGTGRRQYVCARYDAWVVGRAAALLHDGHRSLRELVASVPAGDVVELGGFAEDVLADVDVPADAERLGLRIRR